MRYSPPALPFFLNNFDLSTLEHVGCRLVDREVPSFVRDVHPGTSNVPQAVNAELSCFPGRVSLRVVAF